MTKSRTARHPPVCLFVEDDAPAREIGLHQLQSLGLNVVVAKNGNEALEKLTSLRPDVLVTDLCMPGLDGITLTRMIKKFLPTVPVVACSAVYPEESGEAREILRAGAASFLPKPIDAAALRDLIGAVIDLPPRTNPAALVPGVPDGLLLVPGVVAEYAYEQLVSARTKTHATSVALVGAAGKKHLEFRAPRGFIGPGDYLQLQLRGRILVGDEVVTLSGRVGVRIARRLATNVRSEMMSAEVLSATSVEAWEALREYLSLRSKG